MKEREAYLTAKAAATYLGISRQKFARLAREKNLQTISNSLDSRERLFLMSELAALRPNLPIVDVVNLEEVVTYEPDAQELAELLEVVARSQTEGSQARIDLDLAIENIKARNAEFKLIQQRKQASA